MKPQIRPQELTYEPVAELDPAERAQRAYELLIAALLECHEQGSVVPLSDPARSGDIHIVKSTSFYPHR
jgi:hypothetical protein